ncbi:hypothetical protein SAMN05428949_3016 [Chitinophaga sp. YR627]|nr:hypothetical protein SAMN05428949_3016 [Chitinophaga sp. YR627]
MTMLFVSAFSVQTQAQYIENGNSVAQANANFWISGLGRANNGLWVIKHGADLPITGIRITNPSGFKGVNFQLTDSSSAFQGFSTFLYNGTAWVERMRIAAQNGYVGIGSTTPTYKLDVNDTSSVRYTSENTSTGIPKGPSIQIANTASVDNTYAGIFLTTRNSNGFNNVSYIGSVCNSGVGTVAPEMVFGIRTTFTSYKEAMRITAGGAVGIGTTTVASEYKLAVAGTIGAKKVKVTALGWADFVFDPAYKLSSLNEIEQYIKANRHLEGVPSAAEVEAKGVDLGEMNKILLQKIEELTLHLIEEHKQNEEMKAQMKMMQAEIKTIKEDKK